MRKLFVALLLTSLVMPSVYGQANSAPPPRPLPPRVVAPAVEKPEKPVQTRSFFQRLFGPRATPTPAPTPAPVVTHRPKPKPKPAPETPSDAPAKVTPKATTKVRPADAVPPTPTVATTSPKTGKGAGKKGAASAGALAAGDDAARFKAAKAKALEDAHIKDLKGKADGEVNESEAHKALVNYNRALFQKIREVDPSVSDYAGKVEQSMSKRLGSEKGTE